MPELHTPANRPGPVAVARVTLLPALLVIVAVAVGCALVSPPVGTRHEILTNPGLYIDLLALLFRDPVRSQYENSGAFQRHEKAGRNQQ